MGHCGRVKHANSKTTARRLLYNQCPMRANNKPNIVANLWRLFKKDLCQRPHKKQRICAKQPPCAMMFVKVSKFS